MQRNNSITMGVMHGQRIFYNINLYLKKMTNQG